MVINETQKLSRLARNSQEEFSSQGSLLNQTRLNRFILIALLLHASVIVLQSLIIAKPKDSLALPPIKVKYVDIQKPEPIKKKEHVIKASKPINAEKHKTSKQKIYRQTKAVTPQTSSKSTNTQRPQSQEKFKKVLALSKQRSTKKHTPLLNSVEKKIISEVAKQNTILAPKKRLGSRGTLSMLDGLDLKKYASQDSQNSFTNDPDNDETVSLDTT